MFVKPSRPPCSVLHGYFPCAQAPIAEPLFVEVFSGLSHQGKSKLHPRFLDARPFNIAEKPCKCGYFCLVGATNIDPIEYHCDYFHLIRQAVHQFLQCGCAGCTDGNGFAVGDLRHRQLEHSRGLDVGDLAELLHQFGYVDETGKARMQTVAGAVGRKFHRGNGLAEGACPRIEVMQTLPFERFHLQVTLHREHFGDAVGDGRARGKDNTTASVDSLDMRNFQEHVEGSFGSRLRQASNTGHFGNVKEVLEVVRLIDK